MNKSVLSDMTDANKAMLSKIIPVLKSKRVFKDSEFICLEGKNNDIGNMFDMYCGFDWFVRDATGLRGMAVRCQQSTNPKYETFTLRFSRPSGAKTELQKRIDAIKNNYIYPHYTLQAYLKGDWNSELDYFALIETRELYSKLDDIGYKIITNTDGSKFVVVKWSDIEAKGIRIAIHREDNNQGTV